MAISLFGQAFSDFFQRFNVLGSRWKRSQRLLQGLYFYNLHHTFDTPDLAHWICKLIPAQCPFERDISVLGRIFHIPALCKLNPFYENLAVLRFNALSYLSEDCGEDVLIYCQPAQGIK